MTTPTTGRKILTADEFIELVVEWTEANQAAIAAAWANPGEGWEDWIRIEITRFIQGRFLAADLGRERHVYTDTSKQCDFVLNGQVAPDPARRVVVEIKTQSQGRLAHFRGDFKQDLEKLDELAGEYRYAQRLAIGFFFTKDAGAATGKLFSPVGARNLAEFLNDYHRVYFSSKYKPWRIEPDEMADDLVSRAGSPKLAQERDDVFELGMVWWRLDPLATAEEEEEEEDDTNSSVESSDESDAEQSDSTSTRTKRGVKRKRADDDSDDPDDSDGSGGSDSPDSSDDESDAMSDDESDDGETASPPPTKKPKTGNTRQG
ncbi:hypothetical protein OHB01_07320 [Microbispora hainanensis]|uniref:hypothetical protein n=1 Tax=Microbispora TaxID=2005 RepID=UPI001156FE8A|nr:MULTISPECIES: hypothetical protein [Microbispora]NJP30020.1 hypothetical protein [Microbispora sp. CL1-1]TQS03290.1 hypothetical protein FLW53_38700 [Microbispora sp. SCL1-1]